MTRRLNYEKDSPGGVKACGNVYGYVMQSGLDEVFDWSIGASALSMDVPTASTFTLAT
jgi:hypothetical protein